MKTTLLWSIAIAAAVVASSVHAASAIAASVCDIAKDAKSFDGVLVDVSGLIGSDGMHTVVVLDSACPGVGIALRNPDNRPATANEKRLWDAIFDSGRAGTGLPGHTWKKITATILGTFHATYGGHAALWMQLMDVSNLKIDTSPCRSESGAVI